MSTIQAQVNSLLAKALRIDPRINTKLASESIHQLLATRTSYRLAMRHASKDMAQRLAARYDLAGAILKLREVEELDATYKLEGRAYLA